VEKGVGNRRIIKKTNQTKNQISSIWPDYPRQQ